jgi:hypothetical protein
MVFTLEILLFFQQPLILSALFPPRLVLAREESGMALKGVRKLYFAFPCGEFGVIIVGLGNSGAGGVTGEQTGSGGGLIFGRCFGVDDKFFFCVAV